MPQDEIETGPVKDPRVYLAAERTFLAWIRTGLSLMGFGFVVARFGLFLREMEVTQHTLTEQPRFSLWVGTVLILVGVAVNVLSSVQHIQFVRALQRGSEAAAHPSSMAVAIALTLAAIGLAMTVYLVFVR